MREQASIRTRPDLELVQAVDASKWKQEAGLYGFGLGTCTSGLPGADCNMLEFKFWLDLFNFEIVDTVQVPADLKAGKYILSFRWGKFAQNVASLS